MSKHKKDVFVREPGTKLCVKNENLVAQNRKEQTSSNIPLLNVERLIIRGGSLISTQLLLELLKRQIDIVLLSFHGHFLARIPTLLGKNVPLRREQYRVFEDEERRNRQAAGFVKGKLWNAYIFMKRYYTKHQDSDALNRLLMLYNRVKANDYDIETLMGNEGAGSQTYFSTFGKILSGSGSCFVFDKRTRRPPTDPVNAMLSFGYTMLLKEVLPLIESTGLDPFLGFLHAPGHGRPSLALDIMEEFRSVIVDQLILKLINKRILTADDFVGLDSGGKDGVFLKKTQINVFLRHFCERMETQRFCTKTGKDLSYRSLIRNQVFELIQCVETGKVYRPFRIIK
jgi:CRISPR-associated protein Cas1